MLRGINQQSIFENEEDYEKFLDILGKAKKDAGYELYAYCLMGNHVHLLIKEGQEDISAIMKRIGTSYVYWYNWQYNRKGHLFQDRFKSEAVEQDSYLLTVLRYIHQNPVKAGLSKTAIEYEWSSFGEYIGKSSITDTEFILAIFDENRDNALKEFTKCNNKASEDKCLELETDITKTLSDKEIRQIVFDKYGYELGVLQSQPAAIQNEVLTYLKALQGTSLRQISRLTGYTVNKIFRA
jgi:REP element-mobilizing transposase RayT